MMVRNATHADQPALKAIMLSGLSSDPVWRYCFPRGNGAAAEVVDDALKTWLDNPNGKWLVTLSEDVDSGQPVALAVWNFPKPGFTGGEPPGGEGGVGDFVEFRKALGDRSSTDQSASRLTALATAIDAAVRSPDGCIQKHLGGGGLSAASASACSGTDVVVLILTATLPAHRLRGHTKRLVAHGISHVATTATATADSHHHHAPKLQQQQQQQPHPVAAFAGPMAYVFFAGLGFSDYGSIAVGTESGTETETETAPSDGAKQQEQQRHHRREEEELSLKAMVFRPARGERKRSIIQQMMDAFGSGSSSADEGGGRRCRSMQAAEERTAELKRWKG